MQSKVERRIAVGEQDADLLQYQLMKTITNQTGFPKNVYEYHRDIG